MNFYIKLCLLTLFFTRICFGRTVDNPVFDIKKNIIPFIIGTSLMGLVIIVLLGSFIVFYCRRKNLKKKEYNGVSQVPDEIKLVDFTHGRSSAIHDQSITTKIKPISEECEPKSQINLVGKSSFQLEKPRRYRRASVPASLSVLHEASSSMEAGSRKMSLSYNCVLEPMIDSKRTSVLLSESDTTSRQENNTASKSTSFLESILTEKSSEEKANRYSIYEDDSIASDDLHSKYGKILFSLSYNLDAKTLDVTMKKAEYLSGQRLKGKNHFYVKLRLVKPAMVSSISSNSLSGVTDQDSIKPSKNKKGSFRTSIKADFCNPKFEEIFKFMNVTSHTLKESILQFIIKEETPKFLEKNRIIGQVNFALDDAQLIEKHEMISEIIRDIQPVGPVDSKGRVTFSLYYSQALGILSASVNEVIIQGAQPMTEVLVEICLRSIDGVIVSKKIELDEDLKSSTIVEFPLEKCFLNSFCLVVLLFVRLRNCSKTPYGRFVVGPIRFSDGLGLCHWVDMSVGDKLVVRAHEIM